MRGLKNKSSYLLVLFLLVITQPAFLRFLKSSEKGKVYIIYSTKANEITDQPFYVHGKILYQNPYKFQQELVIAIDDELIQQNDYVINDKGLLGIVKQKYRQKAIVELLTSPKMILQVQINNCYGLYQNKRVTNIDAHCQIEVNDKVYTSNLGYTDAMVLVGYVQKVVLDPNEVTNSVIVKLINCEVIDNNIVVLRGKV